MGKNDEVIAPSAVILLNKFGNLDEIKKISDAIPAPKKNAKKISLMKPVILLKIVNKALTLKPFIKITSTKLVDTIQQMTRFFTLSIASQTSRF